jgi:hypothetical protein
VTRRKVFALSLCLFALLLCLLTIGIDTYEFIHGIPISNGLFCGLSAGALLLTVIALAVGLGGAA